MEYDVVICNSHIHPDIIMYPSRGQRLTHARVLFADDVEVRIGAGAYTGMMMSSLGLKCCYIDKIGSDVFGRFTRDEMKRYELDMSCVKLYEGKHWFCVILVRNGEGGTMICNRSREISSTSFNEVSSMIANAPDARILYVYGWFWSYICPNLAREATHEILRDAKKRKYTIVVDVNYKPKGSPPECEIEELRKSLKYVDVLLPNVRDLELIAGNKTLEENLSLLLQLGPKIIGVKMGDKGCYVASKEQSCSVPAFKVKVLDSTGAGDMFGGAFAYGWLMEWKPKRIATFANAASAFGISHKKESKYPTLQQLQEFLKKADIN